jgi:cytoskeletal protein RodZ
MDAETPEKTNVLSQTSLFAVLHDLRIERGVEREKLAVLLGIPERLIEAIESGDRNRLPSDAYVLGVAKKYAHYFSVPYEDLEKIWQSESETIHLASGKSDLPPQNRFVLTQRRWSISLRTLTTILFFAAAGIYLLAQLIIAALPIRIRVNDLPLVTQESAIEISGTVLGRPKQVLLNRRDLPIENNRFKANLFLVPGPNNLRLAAENYLGITTVWERIIVFQQP